jgi:hypothetical protein
MKFPIFANDYHRRDYDALTEKLFRARVWLRLLKIRKPAPGVPAFIAKAKLRWAK